MENLFLFRSSSKKLNGHLLLTFHSQLPPPTDHGEAALRTWTVTEKLGPRLKVSTATLPLLQVDERLGALLFARALAGLGT